MSATAHASGSRHANPLSSTTTPALSPSSQGVSPAFTLLESPELRPDEVLDIGAAALDSKDASVPAPGRSQGQHVAFSAGQGAAASWQMPECWGHRGASATYPENTRASFLEACKQGADGIETDIHVASDNVLVLFHDPRLDRTTNGTGRIREQPWHGVLEHVRTTEEPVQPIPLFTDVLDILMMEENSRVKLNLDCKVDNDADKLFKLVKEVVERYPDWQAKLAPRIVLGLWHPKFLLPASQILPYLPRYAITMSLHPSRQFFWPLVHGFSVYFELLSSPAGQRFIQECKAGNKGICAWTVNNKEGMRECARWGIRSIISDKPAMWREVKKEIASDRAKALKPTLHTYLMPWLSPKHWWFDIEREARKEHEYLVKEGGKFEDVDLDVIALPPSVVSSAQDRQ